MARLKVNGVEVEVAAGANLLEAARAAGTEIPTLCYLEEIGAITSCMVCVVKERSSGRMVAACSTKALDGMDVDTDGEEVRAARREILTMLLAEHVGDCEAPCSRICPASLNIPRMLRHIHAGDTEAAARIAKRDLIFPATLGHICTAPCEKGCRRGSYDSPLAIRHLHGNLPPFNPTDRTDRTDFRVAIIGAGLAGLSAAWSCLQNGHACRVYEKRDVACAKIRRQLPPEILDAEIQSIGAEIVFGREMGLDFESLLAEFDAIILACTFDAPRNDRIFSAKEDVMPVRAVAHGKHAASQIEGFLASRSHKSDVSDLSDLSPRPHFPGVINSQIGKLRPAELAAYAVERLQPGSGDATSEAARCLHCDCLKPASCKLRRYAEEYKVGPHIVRHMERPTVEAIQRSGDVLFESGKCIKCGICIEITRKRGKDLGLTFTGRGLASRVAVPFGESLVRGLGDAAEECVRACPTGALAFIGSEEETA